MTTEEQRLAEMLHRLTPEPPRPVTVEDVAIRLANQAAPQRRDRAGRNRAGRDQLSPDGHTAVLRIGKRGRLRWAPALAAASVIAVVGASAGIGVALTSHSGKTTPPATGGTTTTPTSTAPTTPGDTSGPESSVPPEPRIPVAGGTWGAELINRQAVLSHALAGNGDSLYALTDGFLVRFDPANGNILHQAHVQATQGPVVAGSTVWVATPNSGGGVVLNGYNATTLAPARTVAVPGGGLAEGILAAGPSGDLYVASGNGVAVVDPATGSVLRHIPVSGQASSVAVSPDGSKLYVAVSASGSFRLLSYALPAGGQLPGSGVTSPGEGGYLVATPGGVWFTTGVQMLQRAWFAPGGNLAKAQLITRGENGGLDSAPTYANGVVWVGGTQSLECLDPSSGKVLGQTAIPADSGIPEHFGSVAYASGHAFATYADQRAHLEGVAAVTPPSSCAA